LSLKTANGSEAAGWSELITSDQPKLMAWTQLLLFVGRPSRMPVLR
jgi:hypothetical protein